MSGWHTAGSETWIGRRGDAENTNKKYLASRKKKEEGERGNSSSNKEAMNDKKSKRNTQGMEWKRKGEPPCC